MSGIKGVKAFTQCFIVLAFIMNFLFGSDAMDLGEWLWLRHLIFIKFMISSDSRQLLNICIFA